MWAEIKYGSGFLTQGYFEASVLNFNSRHIKNVVSITWKQDVG